MKRLGPVAGLASVLCASPSWAQSVVPEPFRGHTIVVDYSERAGPGRAFENTMGDIVYISTEGRIFHKVNTRSSNPNIGGQRELVTGESRGRGKQMQWNGSELVRQWQNSSNGTQLRQTIRLSGGGDQMTCAMTLERLNRPQSQVQRNSCRVMKGNLLAGR